MSLCAVFVAKKIGQSERRHKVKEIALVDMKVHVLSTGVMETDLTWLLLKGGRTIRDRNHKNDPVVWGECPTHAVLIDHPEGKILWDTGVPRDWEERWAPTGTRLPPPHATSAP